MKRKILLPLIAMISAIAFAQGYMPEFDVGNLHLIGNTISSSNTNGHVVISPNGTGLLEYPRGTASTVPYLDANKRLVSSAVSPTALDFVKNLTSDAQAQLNAKANSATLSDNRVIRGDGTAAIQSSGVTLSDGDAISGVSDLTASGSVGAAALVFTGQGSTPASPSAGFYKVYAKNDGKVYKLNSSGTEAEIGSGGISALTGDVSASGTGSLVATITPGIITNSKISAVAGIGVSKLEVLLPNNFVTTSASGVLTAMGYLPFQQFGSLPTAGANENFLYSNSATKDLHLTNASTTTGERIRPEATIDNLLDNPGFDKGTAGWTSNGGAFAVVGIGNTNSQGIGPGTATWDAGSGAHTLIGPPATIPKGYAGANGIVRCRVQNLSGAVSSHGMSLWNGTGASNLTPFVATATASYVEIPFVFGAAGSTIAPLFSASGNEPLISIDNCFVGLNDNIGTVQQASFYGGAEQPAAANCTYSQTTSTALSNYVDLGAAGSCASAWNSYGNCTAVGPTSSSLTCSNMEPGEYSIQVSGYFFATSTANSAGFFQFSDGTNSFGFNTVTTTGTNSSASGTMLGRQTYQTGGVTRTFKIQSSDNGTSTTGVENAAAGEKFIWRVFRYPLKSELAVRSSQQLLPVQTIITANGTYTTPRGATHLDFICAGGGGGGGGGGNTGSVQGGASGTATSVTGVLTASGGASGVTGLPAGGGVTVTSPAVDIGSQDGTSGGGWTAQQSTAVFGTGGFGGDSCFGGRGGGAANSSAIGAAVNTGAGGGGGGAGAVATPTYAAPGGGGGGCARVRVYNPAASYPVTIGGGGGGGAATTNGFAGGAGAAGKCLVTAYFGSTMPIIANSVTSASNGAQRIVSATITPTSAGVCTVSNNPGGEVTATPTGVGDCTANFSAGTFLSGTVPNCQVTSKSAFVSAITQYSVRLLSVSNTAARIYHTYRDSTTGNVTADAVDLFCTGPR